MQGADPVTLREQEKHQALLANSPGYRAFCAEEEAEDPDPYFMMGFADWLLAYPGEAEKYSEWGTERWRAEWDHWHS